MKTPLVVWMLWIFAGWLRMGAQTPDILTLGWTNGRLSLEFRMLPSISEYRILGNTTLGVPGQPVTGVQAGNRWTAGAAAGGDSGFYQIGRAHV